MKIELCKVDYATPTGRNIYTREVVEKIICNNLGEVMVIDGRDPDVVEPERAVVGVARKLRFENGSLVADLDVEQDLSDQIQNSTLRVGMCGAGRQWPLAGEYEGTNIITNYDLLHLAVRCIK